MNDLEDGEIEDSDCEIDREGSKGKIQRHKVPGLSSEEDDSADNSDDDIPVKRTFMHSRQLTGDFTNPLNAAKESGFQYDKNFWLEGAYQSMGKSQSENKPKKRANNIWGAVLEEELLTTEMKGLHNKEQDFERNLGVESYDWRRAKDDVRPHVENTQENSDSDDSETLTSLHVKESFGTEKLKPKRPSIKDRLGSRSDSACSSNKDKEIDADTEEDECGANNVKSRLGELPTASHPSVKDRLGSQPHNSRSIHRTSPVDPQMEGMATSLEHDKLESRIREHQAGNTKEVRMSRKRGNEMYSRNQRERVIQVVPIKHIAIDVEQPTETIVSQVIESLGEPEDKVIIFTRLVELCGAEKVVKLLRATEDVEEMGGITVLNGCRRRTPGGVFFFLMKQDKDITKEIMDEVFKEERDQWKLACKDKKKEQKRRARRKKMQEKNAKEGADYMDDLQHYIKVKKRDSECTEPDKDGIEDTPDDLDRAPKTEMECDTMQPMKETRQLQSAEEDDIFDEYAENIELDVL